MLMKTKKVKEQTKYKFFEWTKVKYVSVWQTVDILPYPCGK